MATAPVKKSEWVKAWESLNKGDPIPEGALTKEQIAPLFGLKGDGAALKVKLRALIRAGKCKLITLKRPGSNMKANGLRKISFYMLIK